MSKKDWAKDYSELRLPMNAKTLDPTKLGDLIASGQHIVEPKLDGTRCSMYIGHPKNGIAPTIRAFARTMSVVDNFPTELTDKIPHICHVERTYLNGTILECEIVHDVGFGASREIMGSSVTRALAMQFGEPVSVRKLVQLGYTFQFQMLSKLEKQRKKDKMPPVKNVVFFENDKGVVEIAPWYGPVKSVVFDIPRYCSMDNVENKTPLYERLKQLDAVFTTGSFSHDLYVQEILYLPAKWGRVLYKIIVKQGGEGVMYKNLNGLYVPSTWDSTKNKVKDSRSSDWRKHKKHNTFDVVIMGYEPAKKMSVKVGDTEPTITKFHKLGWIGAVKFGVYDADGQLMEVGQCSGMTDFERKYISEHQEKCLFRVIEVEANFVSPSTHALHHPRFVRFRDDKDKLDCTFKAHAAASKGCMRK